MVQKEDYATAASELLAALESEQKVTVMENADIMYNLGVAYLQQGKATEAVAAFNDLLKENPEYPNAEMALNAAKQQQGQGQEKAESAPASQGQEKAESASASQPSSVLDAAAKAPENSTKEKEAETPKEAPKAKAEPVVKNSAPPAAAPKEVTT